MKAFLLVLGASVIVGVLIFLRCRLKDIPPNAVLMIQAFRTITSERENAENDNMPRDGSNGPSMCDNSSHSASS